MGDGSELRIGDDRGGGGDAEGRDPEPAFFRDGRDGPGADEPEQTNAKHIENQPRPKQSLTGG